MADQTQWRDPLQGRSFGGAGMELVRSFQTKTRTRLTRRMRILGLLIPVAFGAGWFNGKGSKNMTFEQAREVIETREEDWAREAGVGVLHIRILKAIELLAEVGDGDDRAAQESFLNLYWIAQKSSEQFMRLRKEKPALAQKYARNRLYERIVEALDAQPR